MISPLIVAALGGNALLRRGEPMTLETQQRNTRRAVSALAPIIGTGIEVVITHGNGPQVGLIALQSAAGPHEGQYPLDVLGAESEGMIGYLIEQELRNKLPVDANVATLLTHVLVDPSDPAFTCPTKPIGPTYGKQDADLLTAERNWTMANDGTGWRRIVASPRPTAILQLPVIELIVKSGGTVICNGGGGIPVIRDSAGQLRGIEAVIDKDLSSALLARLLGADHLLLLTDVPGIYLDWGNHPSRLVAEAPPEGLDPTLFPAGSMGPKLSAAIEFASATGNPATIGRLEDAQAMLTGQGGTRISSSSRHVELRR